MCVFVRNSRRTGISARGYIFAAVSIVIVSPLPPGHATFYTHSKRLLRICTKETRWYDIYFGYRHTFENHLGYKTERKRPHNAAEWDDTRDFWPPFPRSHSTHAHQQHDPNHTEELDACEWVWDTKQIFIALFCRCVCSNLYITPLRAAACI